MVRVHKRASKRVSTKQKSKITKKVREHQRKSKKQAKKDPTWRSKKKVDPGIPNSFPYKERMLNEIEQKRIAGEQAKKEAREALRAKPETLQSDDEEMELNLEEENGLTEASTSAVAAPRQFRGTLSDFQGSLRDTEADPRIVSVLLLLDARDPASWRVTELEEQVRSSKSNLTLALTKVDLVPLEIVASWLAHLSASLKCSVFPICSPEPSKHGSKARAAGGIESLVAHLESQSSEKGKGKGESDEEAIAIIGIENSGKTALANVLAPLMPDFSIFDTPSIIAASSKLANLSAEEEEEEEEDDDDDEETLRLRDQEAAHRILIRNSGSVFKIREPLPLIDALMKRVSQVSDLMMAFNVPAFTTTNDFLIGVARTQGRLKKGAVPDTIAASRHILRGWSVGELGYYSKPPNGIEGVEEARESIERDASLKGLVFSRKEWRQVWHGKELRLNSGSHGLLARVKIAFAKPTVVEIEEEEGEVEFDDGEDEEEDDDVDFEDEVDEDEEEEDDNV